MRFDYFLFLNGRARYYLSLERYFKEIGLLVRKLDQIFEIKFSFCVFAHFLTPVQMKQLIIINPKKVRFNFCLFQNDRARSHLSLERYFEEIRLWVRKLEQIYVIFFLLPVCIFSVPSHNDTITDKFHSIGSAASIA